ncbi:uncharacterized protein LOC114841065 [Diachasma alloeum]|uniref:Odorant receptor n=1 Tax=Diachasma alloeum TaxID=454923 RepID=A0A4E0S3P8_9HYME|nr:uncharacterized protein LOC114841065 [Diachasma alloeum]THK32935.1 odorant receptor 40 [Diachasma alloeum]
MDWLRRMWNRPFHEYSSDENYEWEIQFARLALWPSGIWPETGKMTRIRFFSALLIMVGFTIDMVLGMNEIVARMSAISFFTPYIASLISLYSNANTFLSILEEMRGNWKTVSFEDTEILHHYARRSRFFSWIVVMGKVGLQLFENFIARKRVTTPDDSQDLPFSNKAFILACISIIREITLLAIRITEMGINLCFILLTTHICGQLVKLGSRIQAHEGKIRHSLGEDILQRCSCLKCIVDSHVGIYEFVARIDGYFHKTMFLQLSQSVIQFAINGFLVSEAFIHRDYAQLIQYSFYLLLNFPTFLLCCWMAEMVQQQSAALGDIAYSTEWMTKDPKIARHLMFIIRHSRVPLSLTAGKYFVLSLSLFREYVFTSISYLSVLANIKLRQ